MKKLLLIIVVAIAAYAGYVQHRSRLSEAPKAETAQTDSVLASAFENRVSNVQVRGQGLVTRILPDDNDGSRHQRFIVRLGSGQTILIAHNIDLAPRISSLREGDAVSFDGEYEWNPKGGVVHWTHRARQAAIHLVGYNTMAERSSSHLSALQRTFPFPYQLCAAFAEGRVTTRTRTRP